MYYHEIKKKKIVEAINIDKGSGLEIGPLCWPLVLKEEAKIEYVDHTDTVNLKKIYKQDKGVDLTRIVNVDYPLNSRTLKHAVGKKRFDYVIASHVIEHVPDVVRWLQEIASVLKSKGSLALVIPDKRYTFDIDRNTSTPANILGDYYEQRTRPDSATILDFSTHYRLNIDAKSVWDGELFLAPTSAPHKYSLSQSLVLAKDNLRGVYIDSHCSVFTPASFIEILNSLIEIGLLDFKVKSFYETEYGQYEFIVVLEKCEKNRAIQLNSLPAQHLVPFDRELNHSLQKLSDENRQLKEKIDVLQGSRSWKVTRPLRKIGSIGKSVRSRSKTSD